MKRWTSDIIKGVWAVLFVLATFISRSESVSDYTAYGYNQAEYSELFQTMVFLSCKREEPLQKRMEQLSPYHILLLQSWLLSGEPSRLAVRNEIGGSAPMELAENHPEIYDEFKEAWFSGLQKIKERKSTDEELRERADYWARLAEVDLKLLQEHIGSGVHSTAFISDSFKVIQWLDLNGIESEKDRSVLLDSIRKTVEPKLRHDIFDALFFFRAHYLNICEQFSDDSDLYISQKSLCWLVTHGQSNYLPRYIVQSWNLVKTGESLPSSSVASQRGLQSLLTEIIPESGTLLEEQEQLEWVKNHKLRWNEQTKHYEIDR